MKKHTADSNVTHTCQSARAITAASALLLLGGVFCQTFADKLDTRPLTPQEIKDYSLTGLVKSPGIATVGIGDPVYLEAQVDAGTTVTGTVTWTIVTAPVNSAAELEPSPLDSAMPIYNPGDREVSEVADRSFLKPDKPGQYLIRADIPTGAGLVTLEKYITAAHYVGVGTIDGAVPEIPQCGVCHGAFSSDDKVAGWMTTAHHDALVDKLNNIGQPGDHFASYCLSCHTTGYNSDPDADNGGFDDVAVDEVWQFPTEPATDPTHWELMPELLKQKSNIQCEACHGPGSEHMGAVSMNQTSVSLSAGDCAQCHDSEPYHTIVAHWEQSGHAVATRYPTGSERRLSCVRCHSGPGFIQYTDGEEVTDFNYEAISCQVCHDPHDGENHHQVRETGDVTLANDVVVTAGGAGKLCMNCHQSRRDGRTFPDSPNSRHNPHYGPQGDMLAGTNAAEFGMNMPSSGHITAVENSCVDCHMYMPDDQLEGIAGGHTFKMAVNEGEMVQACQSCHGEVVDTFNILQEDFDEDGTVEGVQDEVHGLMEAIAEYLVIDGGSAKVNSSNSLAELRAAYNYNFVHYDGSYGIHNTSYTVAILKASLRALEANDNDEDGMDDTLEIFYFGSTDADPDADDDSDGLTNREELAQGTDPDVRDSDSDGFTDASEIHLGTNPVRADDKPDTNQKVFPAIEFLFYAQAGVSYQIQSTTDLGSGIWFDVGAPVDGSDDFVQTFFSIIGKEVEYYRVLQLGQ